jgi:hypothetical protein
MGAVGLQKAPREDSRRRIKAARGDLTGDKVTNTVECRKMPTRGISAARRQNARRSETRVPNRDVPKGVRGIGFEM